MTNDPAGRERNPKEARIPNTEAGFTADYADGADFLVFIRVFGVIRSYFGFPPDCDIRISDLERQTTDSLPTS